MNNTVEYISDEARRLGEQALAVYNSSDRREWSSQRTENHEESLVDIIPGGIKKIQEHGQEIISDLLMKG